MAHTVQQIAAALGAEAVGNADLMIVNAAEPADAGPDDLALAMKAEYAERLSDGHARVALLWQGADWQAMGLEAAIFAPRPRFAMAGLTQMLDPGQGWDTGIHPSAVIDPTAELGRDVSVGPLTVICAGARIGDRFIAQPGCVVGADGFSYVTPEMSGVELARKSLGDQGRIKAQSYVRIHSLGAVRIGDDVEIGANSTIDRGTIRDTVIGDRTKLDNLVHIGHNCVIGRDNLICGQVGLAGSVTMGNNVVLGGQTGVADNIFVGDNVIAGGATKLMSNVPAGRVMLGYPATRMDTQMETYKYLRRLKRLFSDVAELKKTVSKD
jgi:UDP-3-O-[3-hydroxymyristoyl] glucosamine N-acyltransferase